MEGWRESSQGKGSFLEKETIQEDERESSWERRGCSAPECEAVLRTSGEEW